jgi:Protein of unknown function (DUF3775)
MASRMCFDLDQNRDEISSAERGVPEQRAQLICLNKAGLKGRQIAASSPGASIGMDWQDPHEVLIMQAKAAQTESVADEASPALTISPEKVCFIIIKAREFDAKDAMTEPDPGSNPSDDMEAAVLEEHEDDPVVEEVTSLIDALSEDEQIDLVALTWLGRDDYSAADWPTVREEAARAHNERTASYLLGIPQLGDFLEEGLSMLGYSCEDFEIGRL